MRFVVPLASQDRHEIEGSENARGNRSVNSARDHYVLSAQRDVFCRVGDRVGGAGATGGYDVR